MTSYRAKETYDGWEDNNHLPRQIRALREKENIHGSVYFSSRSLMNHLAGLTDSLRADFYHHPALPPTMPGSMMCLPNRLQKSMLLSSKTNMSDCDGKLLLQPPTWMKHTDM